ncbi:succinylglutamate desuccinylase/aspartoacylase family protein [Cupriavidus pauculus]|uniref:succinylglutamate desuccinylase/aspartoacylase family protein n=1 Tax=Cupriavidus pauculus TaxID=82633 RepID=UPI001EE39EC5|nr:M14 family metallopeptidase [Cupriavidus pauculus]GJG98488.1 succinylglutamate desuccinylase [Cupriavidus pauculus]
MNSQTHTLKSPSPGVAFQLVSHHFGAPVEGGGRKIYIQAGLHADEIPAMLVAVTLRDHLVRLEAQGRLRAEVVLVSAANPIGMAQGVLGNFVGRFELASGRNFNRDFPMLAQEIERAVAGQLTSDPQENVRRIRAAWRDALLARSPASAFASLQQTLMLLAHDADFVLDLHCSREAGMHLYTGDAIWQEVEPLARYLGATASLLALDSGAYSFDEAHSFTWYQLQQSLGERFPIPSGSIAVTVEHRGQRDVSDDLAQADAQALLHYLTYVGAIEGEAPPLPPLRQPATPLAGSEQLVAATTGMLVYRARVGDVVEPGQPLFDIVDPVSGERTTVASGSQGVFYMGRDTRFVRPGDQIGRVSGSQARRTGNLLGP